MNSDPEPFEHWQHTFPPTISHSQFDLLFHLEVVLRHVAYTAASQYLDDGDDVLRNVISNNKRNETLLDKTNEEIKRALRDRDFEEHECPHNIWFLTTKDVCDVILKNWAGCYEFAFPNIKDAELALAPLSRLNKLRNRWAHFRPLPASVAAEVLTPSFHTLRPLILRWGADYFNHSPATPEDPLVQEYCRMIPDVVPRLTDMPPSADAGARDDARAGIYIAENETVYWIVLGFERMRNKSSMHTLFSFADIVQLATDLGRGAIHIRISFDQACDSRDGVQTGLRVFNIFFSVSKRRSVAENARQLAIASDFLKKRAAVVFPAGIGSQHLGLTTLERVSDSFYYSLPWNVIVDPRQIPVRQSGS